MSYRLTFIWLLLIAGGCRPAGKDFGFRDNSSSIVINQTTYEQAISIMGKGPGSYGSRGAAYPVPRDLANRLLSPHFKERIKAWEDDVAGVYVEIIDGKVYQKWVVAVQK